MTGWKARSMLARRCKAKSKHTQEQCRNAPMVAQYVCRNHGGASPQAKKSAKERLMTLVDPAIDALLRALKSRPACMACGRSDADRDPVVIRASQIVLDRTGHGPKATLSLGKSEDDDARWMEFLTDDELLLVEGVIAKAEGRMNDGPNATNRLLTEAIVDAVCVDTDEEDGVLSDAEPIADANVPPSSSNTDEDPE